jgi:ABC-type dipeptide/oligopeptide/nickel transport system permease component
MYLISQIDPTKFLEATALVVAGTLGIIWGIIKFWKSKKKDDNFIEIHTEIHELLDRT